MTTELLKLYRVRMTRRNRTHICVVYARSPEDALAVLAETFESLPDEDLAEEPFGSYQVTEEVSFERGLILSVSSEGNR